MKKEGMCKCIKDLKTKGGLIINKNSEFEYSVNNYDNVILKNKNIAFAISKVEFGDYFVGIVEEVAMKGSDKYNKLNNALIKIEEGVNACTDNDKKIKCSFLGTNEIERCYLVLVGPAAIMMNKFYSDMENDPDFDEMLKMSTILYKYENNLK